MLVHSNRVSSMHSSQECSSSGRYLSDSDLRISQSSQRLSSSQSGSLSSNLSATTKFGVGSCLLEKAASISAIKNSIKGAPVNGHISKTTLALSKSPYDDDNDMFIDLDDSQDPFAFDEDDYASSRWESHPGRQRVQHNQNIRPTFSDAEDECLMLPMLSQEGSASQPMLHQEDFGSEEQTERNHILSDISCTTIDEESFSLVSECLLTAIKVRYVAQFLSHYFVRPYIFFVALLLCFLSQKVILYSCINEMITLIYFLFADNVNPFLLYVHFLSKNYCVLD